MLGLLNRILAAITGNTTAVLANTAAQGSNDALVAALAENTLVMRELSARIDKLLADPVVGIEVTPGPPEVRP